MTEKQKISSFCCGLKNRMRFEVKSRKPTSLLDAQGLARHYERTCEFKSRSRYFGKFGSSASTTNPVASKKEEPSLSSSQHEKISSKKMTVKQMQERTGSIF